MPVLTINIPAEIDTSDGGDGIEIDHVWVGEGPGRIDVADAVDMSYVEAAVMEELREEMVWGGE
jgi:hypothetical protein